MTDEHDIGQDKRVADEKLQRGEDAKGNAAVQPQPGRKPPQVDEDTEPSNSRARELYKQGQTPKDQSHDTYGNPDEGAKPKD